MAATSHREGKFPSQSTPGSRHHGDGWGLLSIFGGGDGAIVGHGKSRRLAFQRKSTKIAAVCEELTDPVVEWRKQQQMGGNTPSIPQTHPAQRFAEFWLFFCETLRPLWLKTPLSERHFTIPFRSCGRE
jgi:hypothetical protein